MNGTNYLLFDFVKGEARVITQEEHDHLVVEYMKRTMFKDGIMFISASKDEE